MIVLTLASSMASEPGTTGSTFSLEANSASAVNFVPARQTYTRNRSALADTGVDSWKDTEEIRKECEKALKTYRKLAEKEPEAYLPGVAATLNDLAIIDGDKNAVGRAREEFVEALNTYRELADKQPDIYLRYVTITLNNLGILEGAPKMAGRVAEDLSPISGERTKNPSALHGGHTQ